MAKEEQVTNNLNLSPIAMEAFGFSQQPFASNILSEEAIFIDAILEQLLETTKHHLQFSDLLLIIEGNFGSGKTTLFRRLIQSEIANSFVMPIHAETTDTLTQIQQKMSIHLKDQGDANYLDDNLKNLQVFDQTPIIILDDAHVLSDTTLQEILRYQKQLETEKEVKLKILLLANKGMANTIEQISDIQENQLYVQEVPAYTEKQISAYLNHKLKVAKYSGEPLFNDKDIQLILKKSDGTPLQIMSAAVDLLDKRAKKSNRPSFLKIKPILILATIVIVTLLGISGYYFLQQKPENELVNVPAPVVEQPVVTQPQIKPTNIPAPEPKLETQVTEPVITEKPAVPQEHEITATETPLVEALPEETVKTESEATLPLDIKPDVAHAEETKLELETSIETLTETKTVEEKQAEPVAPPKIIEEPEPETKPLHPALVELQQIGVQDSAWLLEQSSNNWTLQILGGRDPNTLLYFAKRYQLAENSAWYQTQLSNKPWYVLVYGLYTNRDAAHRAKDFLPGDLKNKQPFAKNIKAIHQAIQ